MQVTCLALRFGAQLGFTRHWHRERKRYHPKDLPSPRALAIPHGALVNSRKMKAGLATSAIVLFLVTSHLGGMYNFYRQVGPGQWFSLWGNVPWLVDLPVSLVLVLTGLGLRFEITEVTALEFAADLATLATALSVFWFALIQLALSGVQRVRAVAGRDGSHSNT